MLTAITREVSASISDCELSFHARQAIDVAKAIAQHMAYQDCLAKLGVRIVSLPAEPELPDAVFVEDPAVIVDEVAVISIMGPPSRRPEADSLAHALSPYRPITFLREPATLDGGDVLRIGRRVFAGLSQRTNREGIAQLRDLLQAFDYEVQPVEVRDCLHLKSACSYIGNDTILINRALIDAEQFHGFELLDVPDEEPNGANALLLNDVVIIAASFPKTRALLEQRRFRVQTIDLSELQKAEAGVTCCSLIFSVQRPAARTAILSVAKKRIVSRGQTLIDGEEDAGSLAFAHHAHDVISGRKLLSVHRFVDVRFGFALEQNHRGR
jgi:dimethylargininase